HAAVAEFAGTFTRAARGTAGRTLQPVQGSGLFDRPGGDPRRSGDRDRAGGLYRAAWVAGSGAEHLVAAGRALRNRLDFARRSEYQAYEIGAGFGMGEVEFFLADQSVADAHGSRDSCA